MLAGTAEHDALRAAQLARASQLLGCSVCLLAAAWRLTPSTGPHRPTPSALPQLVPALSKWGGAVVGLTLVAIGAMGLYETFFEHHEEGEQHAEHDPAAEALTGAYIVGGVWAVAGGGRMCMHAYVCRGSGGGISTSGLHKAQIKEAGYKRGMQSCMQPLKRINRLQVQPINCKPHISTLHTCKCITHKAFHAQ